MIIFALKFLKILSQLIQIQLILVIDRLQLLYLSLLVLDLLLVIL